MTSARLKQCESSDQAGIHAALSEDGAVVVNGLFEPERIDAVRRAIDAALAPEDWCNSAEEGYGAEFFGRRTKRLHGVLQYSPEIEHCLMHPLPQSTAERWLGCRPHFSTGEVMAIGPGESRQDLHTDGGSWRHAQLPGEVLFSMTVALTTFTEANGATVVAPGSHRWPADRQATDADLTAAEMAPGSVLFYSGNVVHGGGANRTDTTRIGLYLGYIPFWLQPLENAHATHPVGFLDTLDAATQRFVDHHPAGFRAVL